MICHLRSGRRKAEERIQQLASASHSILVLRVFKGIEWGRVIVQGMQLMPQQPRLTSSWILSDALWRVCEVEESPARNVGLLMKSELCIIALQITMHVPRNAPSLPLGIP